MQKIERLVIAVLIAAFVVVSIPKIIQRREELKAQQPGTGAPGTEPGSGNQPADTALPQYPPPALQPAEPFEAPYRVDALPVAAPAVNPNALVFTRWVIVVSLFVVTVLGALGVGMLAIFALRSMRRQADRSMISRTRALNQYDQARRYWEQEAGYRNEAMRRASRPADDEEPQRRRFL